MVRVWRALGLLASFSTLILCNLRRKKKVYLCSDTVYHFYGRFIISDFSKWFLKTSRCYNIKLKHNIKFLQLFGSQTFWKRASLFFLWILFTCTRLLQKAGLHMSLFCVTGQLTRRAQAMQDWRLVPRKRPKTAAFPPSHFHVSSWCMCSVSTYMNYKILFCGHNGIWPSFYESMLMNNWETSVFRNHKGPSFFSGWRRHRTIAARESGSDKDLLPCS